MDLQAWLTKAVSAHREWTDEFPSFEPHGSLHVTDTRFATEFAALTKRLKDNYPFFHPNYAGQMLKPPHPAAVVGYLSAMLVNPNNHALDGGPATAQMEREVIAEFAGMFGFARHLGHLTTSGTIANLEALYVARESHPGRAVAYSSDAHYTHGRMCHVLGIEGHPVHATASGHIDLEALESAVRSGSVGTVVLTAGTTGLGAIDPIHEALALRERYGVRIHVDAAYGGFFALLAGTELPAEPWQAISHCDSVVVDPHKHGLQPYGCGAVLFADPDVGRFYKHDSPYTYFTSDELHLGEISLECSRAGAAAAALWLTLQLFPLRSDGLGTVLAAGRRAALRWADLIEQSEVLNLHRPPELDIVTYYPVSSPFALSAIDDASGRLLDEGMSRRGESVFLSTLRIDGDTFQTAHPEVIADRSDARVLRSVLMKPEAEHHVERLHDWVEDLASNS